MRGLRLLVRYCACKFSSEPLNLAIMRRKPAARLALSRRLASAHGVTRSGQATDGRLGDCATQGQVQLAVKCSVSTTFPSSFLPHYYNVIMSHTT